MKHCASFIQSENFVNSSVVVPHVVQYAFTHPGTFDAVISFHNVHEVQSGSCDVLDYTYTTCRLPLPASFSEEGPVLPPFF